jgi:hypothetical protein
MHFSEPLTDFHANLYSDEGQAIEVDFNVTTALWRLTADPAVSRETLRDMVGYLHAQFYVEEDNEYLADWLAVVDSMLLGKKTTITLKTVDRIER